MNENNITKYYCSYLCPRRRVAFGSRRFGCLSAAHRTLIRSIGVFLARGRFAAKTPIMSVGFPWILSSESIFFNWLSDQKRGKVYRVLFPRVERRRTGARGLGLRKGGIVHVASLAFGRPIGLFLETCRSASGHAKRSHVRYPPFPTSRRINRAAQCSLGVKRADRNFGANRTADGLYKIDRTGRLYVRMTGECRNDWIIAMTALGRPNRVMH
jgi:hypothetical protein